MRQNYGQNIVPVAADKICAQRDRNLSKRIFKHNLKNNFENNFQK